MDPVADARRDAREQDDSPSPRRSRRLLAVVGWIARGAVVAASGVLYATLPPSPDQWFLGYTGWMMTRGAIPYVRFADGNWPASHWLHAASVLLLGNTPYTWRVVDFALMLIAVSFAAAVARSVWGRPAARWLFVLYPSLYVALGYWFSGERDFVGAHLLFISIWFYWSGLSRRQAGWQVGTGALIAFAALVKPTFAVFGPALALHCLLTVKSSMCGLRQRVLHVVVAGLAAVLGLLAGLGMLVLQGTPLEAFWDLAVRSVVVRYGNDERSWTTLLRIALEVIANNWHWIFAGAAVALVLRLHRREPDGLARNLLFPTLFVTGIATYALQAQGLGYTLAVLFAPTIPILCSGLGLVSWRWLRERNWRSLLLAACVLLPILGTAKKWTGEFRSSWRWLSGRIDAAQHYSSFDAGDGISAAEAMRLAAELKERIPEGGTILVWGRANVVNFLAERPQPTRFHHDVTITRPYLPERLATTWNRWFQEEIEASAPGACVVNPHDLEGPRPQPSSVTFLRAYLREHYVPTRRVGECWLYLRAR